MTADGVAVRVLPGADQPLVEGYHVEGRTIPEVRLSEGDTVGVHWGPVVVDGYSWYSVIHGDTDDVTWSEGWVAGEYLAEVEPMELHPLVAAADGQGAGAAVSGGVTRTPL